MLSEAAECLESEDWDQLYSWLGKTLKVANADEATQKRNIRLGGTVLIESCSKHSVPLKLFELVVELTGSNEPLLYQDDAFRTPLHAVISQLSRPDLCQFLVDEGGSAALESLDHSGLRPIDVLTQRILMLVERLRYLQKRVLAKGQRDLELCRFKDCWECARVLCLGHCFGNRYHDRSLPLLHAIYLSRHAVPVEALVQRALMTAKEKYQHNQRRISNEDGDQSKVEPGAHPLLERDPKFGNTPLHVFVSIFAHQGQSDDQEEEEEEENEDENFLKELLRLAPQAAATMNKAKLYPLDLAIDAGRTWSSGCKMLLQAYPSALVPNQIIGLAPTTSSNNSTAQSSDINPTLPAYHLDRAKWLVFWILVQEGARRRAVQLDAATPREQHSKELCNIVFQVLRARPQIIVD
mmetsp:Transcript_3033/g.8576  ORF Transcript_3033/g.8576 Transcript_3033/m.8576 type:complete len:409 (+) Transcript_3033:70-1296(+)